MVKGSDFDKAWDRWTEEVDLEGFLYPEDAWNEFKDWLNPHAGKNKGLDEFREFVYRKFEEFTEELPPTEKYFREWLTEEQIPPEKAMIYKEAYEYAFEAENLNQAWGRFWGKLGALRLEEPAKTLWNELRRFFL